QGNTLRSGNVIPTAVKAFIETQGAITDRALAALEAGDRVGGDSRCSCAQVPAGPIPCDAKTAHVAYILMADPNDTSGDSHNHGKYALYITASQPRPHHPAAGQAG